MNAELDRLDAIRKEKLARYEDLKEQAFQAQQEYSAASQAFSTACEKDREDFATHPMWQQDFNNAYEEQRYGLGYMQGRGAA